MTNETNNYNKTVFESIKHIDEEGNEYWLARELQVILEYKEWRNFEIALKKAKISYNTSNYTGSDRFVEINKTIIMPKGATKKIKDYKLSRYACYLIVQNSDSSKNVVALGQTYFAVQTRRQELLETQYEQLSEDE